MSSIHPFLACFPLYSIPFPCCQFFLFLAFLSSTFAFHFPSHLLIFLSVVSAASEPSTTFSLACSTSSFLSFLFACCAFFTASSASLLSCSSFFTCSNCFL